MRSSFAILRGGAALLSSLIVLSSNEVLAADALTEQAYLQDLPVVLTASRLSQPISEAPNAVSVIDRQMIVASGFRTIADLFRLVPGMYVGNSGANTPIVSLNGVTDQYSRRMQVLVDGRSVYLPPLGGVNWQDIPLLIDDIERIEVVRGPAAASHGSNSFYGVINVITRDAASVKIKTVSVNRGGMGISDLSAHLGNAGEDFDYRLSFGYRSDGGDNPQVLNDGSTNRILNLRTNFRTNGENSLEFMLGVDNGMYGQGTMGNPPRYGDAFRNTLVNNDFQQLAWLHTWSTKDETKVTLFRTDRDYTDPYKCINLDQCNTSLGLQGFGQDVAKSQRQEVEVQNTTQLGAINRVVWGGGIRTDYAYQPLIFNTPVTLHQSRMFAHDEWRVTESALVNVGGMFEDDGAGHKNLSPRIALNYHVLPRQTFRVSISSATRNPAMAELDMNTAYKAYWVNAFVPPATDIRPEKILSKEIGYVGEFGSFSMDGRLYYDKVKDIIMLDGYVTGTLPQTNSFKNLFDARYKGLEMSAKFHWQDGNVVVNYSHQQASCAFSSYPTQYSNSIIGPTLAQAYQTDYLNLCSQSVPEESGSLLFDQHLWATYQFSLGYYARSKVRVTDVASIFPPESPMHRVDIRIAKEFGQKAKSGGGEMAVVLQNAFQDNYTGYGNVSQRVNLLFNRRVYFTATINF